MLQAEEMQDAAAAPEKLDPAEAAAEAQAADLTPMDIETVIKDPEKPEEPKADAAVSAESLANGCASTAPEAETKEANGKQEESRDKGKDSEKDAPKVRAFLGPLAHFGRGQNGRNIESLTQLFATRALLPCVAC